MTCIRDGCCCCPGAATSASPSPTALGAGCSTVDQAAALGIAVGTSPGGITLVVPDGVRAVQARLPRHPWRTFPSSTAPSNSQASATAGDSSTTNKPDRGCWAGPGWMTKRRAPPRTPTSSPRILDRRPRAPDAGHRRRGPPRQRRGRVRSTNAAARARIAAGPSQRPSPTSGRHDRCCSPPPWRAGPARSRAGRGLHNPRDAGHAGRSTRPGHERRLEQSHRDNVRLSGLRRPRFSSGREAIAGWSTFALRDKEKHQ
ncbi:MAG: hypothetical protein JWR63_1103 [Conexibacter sp.]|nr:hypothetical protein [Conexibacter sp.]